MNRSRGGSVSTRGSDTDDTGDSTQDEDDSGPPPRWEKVLFKRQAFPDNYVDESFLESLVMNASVRPHRFGNLVRGSVVIAQQITSVAIFLLCFTALRSRAMPLAELAALQIGGTVAVSALGVLAGGRGAGAGATAAASGGATRRAVDGAGPGRFTWRDAALQGAAILALMWGVSPIIKTLTHSYTGEAIWAYAVLLCALHITFHEYRLARTTEGG